MFEVKIDRDLKKFLGELQPLRFNKRFLAVRLEFNARLSEIAAAELRKALDELTPDTFEDLSEKYLAAKIRQSLDARPWHATGFLADNVDSRADQFHVEVGWVRGLTHPANGEPLAAIAAALEYGVADRGLPARPVIRPTFAKIKPLIEPLFREVAYRRFKIPFSGK